MNLRLSCIRFSILYIESLKDYIKVHTTDNRIVSKYKISDIEKEAAQYVSTIDPKVVLIDGSRLVDLMIDYNPGVSTMDTYKIKNIDTDFFLEKTC